MYILIHSSLWFFNQLLVGSLPTLVFPFVNFKHNKERLKSKTGVYALYCKSENKYYIGSAKDLYGRLSTHLFYPKRSNRKLQEAILKNGKNDFIIIILKDLTSFKLNNPNSNYLKVLLDIEDLYLKTLFGAKLYNISPEARSSEGMKHTEESKLKISLSKKGHKSRLGAIHTEETKLKIKQSLIGRFTGTNSSRSKPVVLLNTLTGVKLVFDTMKLAAGYLKVNRNTLPRYIDTNKLFKKTWLLTSLK